MSTAKTPAMSSEKLNCKMRLPRPFCAPTNSPTMAPSTLKTTAMSRPANTKGSALGKVTSRNVCQRLALSERMRSSLAGSIVLSPTITLTSTGKKATVAATMILEEMPKPNQTMMSGAIAIFGSVWSATRYG